MANGYLLVLFLFEVSGYAKIYFVSEVSSQWEGKNNICSIAVPPIKHKATDIFVEINSTLLDTGNAWVGYIKTQRLFDYIGCFKESSLDMIQPVNVKVGSPGQCSDVCNHSSLIGLSVNECFCTKETTSFEDLRSNNIDCTTECEGQSGVACGNQTENGTYYVSIYKDTEISEDITSDIDEDAHCLRLDQANKTFVWTQCSKDLLAYCDFNGTCIATSNPGTNKKWIGSANSCFSNRGSPVRSNNCKEVYSFTNIKLPVWTSFIRSYVISSSMNQSVDSGIKYGYVKKQAGRLVLRFTKDYSKKKKILCIDQQIQILEEDKKLSLLVFLTIIVSAVVVVVVFMVFTVIHWRRRKCRQRHKRNNTSHYESPVVSFIASPNYASVDDTSDQKQVNQDDYIYQRIEGKHGKT